MPCVKWKEVEFTGFKVYKWNEWLFGKNLPPEEGLIVFRRDSSHVKRIIKFNIHNMVHQVPDLSTGQYSPRQDGLAFTLALNNSNVFFTHPENQLIVNEINSFLLSFFTFSEFTVSHPSSPTLVFVLDFSYYPNAFLGCPSSWFHLLNEPPSVCTKPHVYQQGPLFRLYDNEENEALEMYYEEDPDLVVPRSIDEVADMASKLRLFCRLYKPGPVIPVCCDAPAGLVEVKAPSVVMLDETVSFNCPICLCGMGSESVLKTKCGHMLHKTCARPLLRFDAKCPICRSSSVTVL